MATPTGEVRRVADIVLSRILSGAYPCGLRLPSEASLAEELSCGRSTLREALRYLAGLGLVKSRRGSGAMVLDFRREGAPALLPMYIQLGRFDVPAGDLAREMLRIRTLLASEAVRLAARYAKPEKLGEARKLLAAAPALEHDPAAHALNELEMYRALVAASGMWPAMWMVNTFWAPLRDMNTLFAPAMGTVQTGFQETMEQLFDLVAAGEVEAAVAHINDYFAPVDAKLIGIIERALGGAAKRTAQEKSGAAERNDT